VITIRASINHGDYGHSAICLDIAGTGVPGIAAHLVATIVFDDLRRFSSNVIVEIGRVAVLLYSMQTTMGGAHEFVDRFNADTTKHVATLGALLTVLGAYPP
jgi:hypothetical protein